MVLVDTSVWIAHLRERQPALADLLCDGLVVTHPFVNGELACGNLSKRAAVLADLAALPTATRASDAEVMQLVEDRKLWGRGLGWIDAHLLASALISHCRLWTFDKRLGAAASELGLK
ncbi:MAG: type II toxin-antitoxin system VapC family toxin [Bryobacteraceae bacterium]